MPQVQAVGTFAHPAQGREVQQAAQHLGGTSEHVGQHTLNHAQRQQGGAEQTPGNRAGCRLGNQNCVGNQREQGQPANHDAGERDQAEGLSHTVQHGLLQRRVQRPGARERQQGAEQQAVQVRVGTVVDAANGCARHQKSGGGAQRRNNTQHHDHAKTTPAAAQQHAGANNQQRPYHVELFFHRQGPEVREELRGGLREVVVTGKNGNPVGREGRRTGELTAQVHLNIAANEQTDRSHDQNQQGNGGKQTAGTSDPEIAQGNFAGESTFTQKQGGNQETGDDEENIHANHAAG